MQPKPDPYPNLRRESSRLARRLILNDTPASREFWHLVTAAYKKPHWTYREWQELLASIDATDDTVQDYLDLVA